ncbi:hypothetical protein TrVE_jg2089 [Triparma verrucosa]|uniref:Uncharacterized protein n=1 Tax=Triparma verrucosa TaxID=1606542 RepID=A0A9W7CPU1_9STRA|nr:hypothetical protein TrVE_jg2089 [Triparma verrucosa]
MQLSKKLYRFWNETRRQQQKTDVNMAITSLNRRVQELENQNQNLREFLRLDKDKLPLAYDMATSLYAEDGARRLLLQSAKSGKGIAAEIQPLVHPEVQPSLEPVSTSIRIPLIPSEILPRSSKKKKRLPFTASSLNSVVLKKSTTTSSSSSNSTSSSTTSNKENLPIKPHDLLAQRSQLNKTSAPSTSYSSKKRLASSEPSGFLARALKAKFVNAKGEDEEEGEESEFEWSAVKKTVGGGGKKEVRKRLSLVQGGGGGGGKKRRV